MLDQHGLWGDAACLTVIQRCLLPPDRQSNNHRYWSKARHCSELGLCMIRLPATIPTMGRCLPIPQGPWPHPEWEGSQNPKYSLDYPHKCLNLCVQGQLHCNRAEESSEAEHVTRAFLCLHITASSSSPLPLSPLSCRATGKNPSSPGCTKSAC